MAIGNKFNLTTYIYLVFVYYWMANEFWLFPFGCIKKRSANIVTLQCYVLGYSHNYAKIKFSSFLFNYKLKELEKKLGKQKAWEMSPAQMGKYKL